MSRFEKVLIANRGEVAVRIARALRELGIRSVAVHSASDDDAPHVRACDEAVDLGDGPADVTYLAVDKVLAAARATGAEAIHPGYGFLAENAGFARACAAAGVVFVGPSPESIVAMGSKTEARRRMSAAGVPVVPGTLEPLTSIEEARQVAAEVGFPVAMKAVGGGGGKGFRVAHGADEVDAAFAGAASEGQRFFADDRVYVERYLPDPRHVEVQILADAHGNVVHLGERDCSVQRRHQKVIEEAPAPMVDAALRERLGEIAVQAARAIGYVGVGTIEGLLVDGEYFFLEMNTRLQVEHPVTEMVTGIDLVREQVLVAAGGRLSVTQDDVRLTGCAIECRINAENAAKRFAPSPGRVVDYRPPEGPGVRVDSGVTTGSTVSPHYDPLMAKLIVWDVDRERATQRMLRALDEFELTGVATLLPFHRAFLRSEQWQRGETGRDLIEDRAWLKSTDAPPVPVAT